MVAQFFTTCPSFERIHLLPFFPWSSDDGFSVIDYRRIRPDLGDWQDVELLGESFDLAIDFVMNHCSQESAWFQPAARKALSPWTVTRPLVKRAEAIAARASPAGQRRTRSWTAAFGVHCVELPGYEADDVLGTLTRQAEAAGCEVMLVTGDKDLMQLVGETTKLYNVFKPKVDLVIQGLEEVEEETDVYSAYVSYYTTEFFRMRLGYEHRASDHEEEDGLNSLFVEFNFVFGSHPAEPWWVNR